MARLGTSQTGFFYFIAQDGSDITMRFGWKLSIIVGELLFSVNRRDEPRRGEMIGESAASQHNLQFFVSINGCTFADS
jgi:hypothetical protein